MDKNRSKVHTVKLGSKCNQNRIKMEPKKKQNGSKQKKNQDNKNINRIKAQF